MGSHESKREAFLVISDPGMNSRGPGMPTSMFPVHEIKYTSDLFYPLLLWVSVYTADPNHGNNRQHWPHLWLLRGSCCDQDTQGPHQHRCCGCPRMLRSADHGDPPQEAAFACSRKTTAPSPILPQCPPRTTDPPPRVNVKCHLSDLVTR